MGARRHGAVRQTAKAVIVAHHAPAPDARTGVADYAVALEAALSRLVTITRDAPPDVHLYHLGNNRLHEAIYHRALETPGVIVLHDAVLQHFMLAALAEREYIDEFAYNYGEWHRDIGRELWRDRAASSVDPRYFRYPMLRRVVERSLAVIVHNAGAAAMVRSAAANVPPVFVIPHLHAGAGNADGDALRVRIGAPPATVLFGIFGYLRESKRIPACIAAFRRLHALRPGTALLLAGQVVSKDLARLLCSEAAHPAIHRLDFLNAGDFASAVAAVDCCVNLRYPAAGETSGISIHAMGAAKPVVLTANAENGAYPEETCLRVAPGAAEMTELFDAMTFICEFPRLAREIGLEAQRHIQTAHAPERVAPMYLEVLRVAAHAARGSR